MRPSTACLGKGFIGRSLDEFRRLSRIALNNETIKGVGAPLPLHSFYTAESVDDCKLMSDKDIGGFSEANLNWIPANNITREPTHARFHGTVSTKLPETRTEIQRSGYAAWRTKDQQSTLFGRGVWDIDVYTYLALRIKSDGRSYLVNVQTESIEPTDLHQHRLFVKRPGEWETVLIKWNDFVRTNHGFVVEPQTEMLRQKVKSVGIGLTDRVPGPFELCIERIWATNERFETETDKAEAEAAAVARTAKAGGLKDKTGKHIKWTQ